MPISVCGIILFANITFFLAKKHSVCDAYYKLMELLLMMSFFVKMGYLIKIGERLYTYEQILIYAVTLLSIWIIKQRGIKKRELGMLLILSAVFFANFLSTVLHPLQGQIISNWTHYVTTVTGYVEYSDFYKSIAESKIQAGYYIQFYCFMIITFALHRISNVDNNKKILKRLIGCAKVCTIIAVLDAIFRNIFHSSLIPSVMTLLFGDVGIAQHSGLMQRGVLFELTGTAQEASMLNYILFNTIILFLISKKQLGEKVTGWVILDCVVLAINPSLSAYVYLGIVFLIIYMGCFNSRVSSLRQVKKIIEVVCLLLVIAICLPTLIEWLPNNYLTERIKFASKMITIMMGSSLNWVYSSEAIRFIGIIQSIRYLAKRPLFGLGMGQLTCDSAVVTLFSNIGIVGGIIWLFIVYYINKETKEKSIKYLVFFILVYIAPNLMLNDLQTLYMTQMIALLYFYPDNTEMEVNQNEIINNYHNI